MMKWIESLNKVYEENCCTDDGRVMVEYCPKLKVVVIKVLDKYEVINANEFPDWVLLNKIQDIIREMYEAV